MLKLNEIKGVGDATVKKLKELGIETVFGLLSFFPTKYIDLGVPIPVNSAEAGQYGLFEGIVTDVKTPSTRGRRGFQVTLRDALNGFPRYFKIMFYNQPYLSAVFETEQKFRILAKPSEIKSNMLFVNPIFERNDKISKLDGVYTVYPLKGIIPQGIFKKIVRAAIEAINPDNFTDITSEINKSIFKTLKEVHLPCCVKEAETARETLASIDIAVTLSIHRKATGSAKISKVLYKNLNNIILDYKNAQPYELTISQDNAVKDILSDLENGKTSRIVLGDVGSGKTAVGFFALCAAAENCYQSVMIAPTEILARQHYVNFANTAAHLGIGSVLLTGSLKQSERKTVLKNIENGEIKVIFGTQALISDSVQYKNLKLAVIDEQHRFGVNERAALERKGAEYVLSMTATPIPRSLALTFYDDLPVSDVFKRENAAANVSTKIVYGDNISGILKEIAAECAKGNQSFIICPAIQDNEGFDVYSLETLIKQYGNLFENLEYGVLYGKMRAEDKASVMGEFASGKTKLLLSTTVIEVGVDTLAKFMVIMNADRFGLAALHQLRGRIGRDGSESTCFLHTGTQNEAALERLRYLQTADSGQAVAEYDFTMRGAGEILGTRQSGATSTPIFGLPVSASSLQSAKKMADGLNGFTLPQLLALTRGNKDKIYAFLENLKNTTLNS